MESPMPLIWLSRSSAITLSSGSAISSSARAALVYARDLNGFSPFNSSNVAMFVRTLATSSLFMCWLFVHQPDYRTNETPFQRDCGKKHVDELLHLFHIGKLPNLVEEFLFRGVEAGHQFELARGVGGHPVGLLSVRSFRAEIDVDGAVRILSQFGNLRRAARSGHVFDQGV